MLVTFGPGVPLNLATFLLSGTSVGVAYRRVCCYQPDLSRRKGVRLEGSLPVAPKGAIGSMLVAL